VSNEALKDIKTQVSYPCCYRFSITHLSVESTNNISRNRFLSYYQIIFLQNLHASFVTRFVKR